MRSPAPPLIAVFAVSLGACAGATGVHPPPRSLGFPAACARSGALHLTAVGAVEPGSVEVVAARYTRLYRIPVRVLPPVSRVPDAWDAARGQYAGEALLRAVSVAHAAVLVDPSARLIALTDDDQFLRSRPWRYAFSAFDDRVAVISAARMDPVFYGEPQDRSLRQARLHRMMTRVLGGLYCRLPRTGPPASVLRPEVMSLQDLDAIDETVW